ncbi:hypothetical protein H072_8892 [Dactylellina haptotyla CBS 200.50]|uniref:F-box domain-containing protein n=1 Tax=Dactylellina haptotyla (strain CBS 200.50) TaxID=1284197 RepID=S8BDU9_DACHA|nr:hypothetical protein H072_8892 [Dactylellina haptotyla CBS 200.50]
MPLDQLPPEILLSLANECGIQKADILHLILTCRNLYQNLRQFLFCELSYGYLARAEMDSLLSILDLHGFGFRERTEESPADPTPDQLLITAIQNGWITKTNFSKVKELRLYSDIESLQNSGSIIDFLELIRNDLESISRISSGTPNIGAESEELITGLFNILRSISTTAVQLHLVTDLFQCLDLVSRSPPLVLDTLFIDASLSNREEIETWQEGIKQFSSLTRLAYKGMSPWAVASNQEIADHCLCDDFPNLKFIHLICSPNFRALPRSINEIYIDIGEKDQIIHHCFPLITTIPNLQVLYALNRQNILPRYHGNPLQTPRLPGTATSILKRIHAEMPRPDEKLMFFPPGVLETITNCNPNLENIFLPFLSAYDINQLATSDCTRTLRTLEIQSSVCRTITRESSFDVSHLVHLFSGPGVPNLEILRWAIGGRREMAVTKELILALYPTGVGERIRRRHNLQLMAVESRLPVPESPYVMAGILHWGELLEHRKALLAACYESRDSGGSAEGFIKPVRLTVDSIDQDEAESDLEFPYVSPKSVVVEHHLLSGREKGYLRNWRKSGGAVGVTVSGENEGLVYDFRKSVFEELYFFNLKEMGHV